ncbi:MAG: hypothetical protein RIC55_03855 [Pirellulaceae bacterium]
MKHDLAPYLEFFRQIGADEVEHTEKTYLAHAASVYRDLKSWSCDEEVCLAGLFHSIYGTEVFKRFALPVERREDVRALIGARAEQLAYWNSAMCRLSFDKAVERGEEPYSIVDRMTGGEFTPTPAEFDDLCRIHLCDWLEQVPRSREWNYRREAYRLLSERLGGAAREAYERVYSAETDDLRAAAG